MINQEIEEGALQHELQKHTNDLHVALIEQSVKREEDKSQVNSYLNNIWSDLRTEMKEQLSFVSQKSFAALNHDN